MKFEDFAGEPDLYTEDHYTTNASTLPYPYTNQNKGRFNSLLEQNSALSRILA